MLTDIGGHKTIHYYFLCTLGFGLFVQKKKTYVEHTHIRIETDAKRTHRWRTLILLRTPALFLISKQLCILFNQFNELMLSD